jgi:Lactonase, 7-bladed beta-propeller
MFDVPRGSFAISGHDAPHAHMIESDPSGRYVYWADLGQDRIYISQFNLAAGTLSNPTFINTSPGAGPRHFAFHMFRLFNQLSRTTAWLSATRRSAGPDHPFVNVRTQRFPRVT